MQNKRLTLKPVEQFGSRGNLQRRFNEGHAAFHGPDCRCSEAEINTIVTGMFGSDCRRCWQSSDGYVTTLVWPCRQHRRELFWQSFLAWMLAGTALACILAVIFMAGVRYLTKGGA